MCVCVQACKCLNLFVANDIVLISNKLNQRILAQIILEKTVRSKMVYSVSHNLYLMKLVMSTSEMVSQDDVKEVLTLSL